MGNFYMEATQINYRRDDKPKTVDQKLQELSETSAIDTDIAPVFKSTNTYQPGDMVYYCNKLYVFNVEHTGTWAAADVTETDVTTEISSLKSGLSEIKSVSETITLGAVLAGNLAQITINGVSTIPKAIYIKDISKGFPIIAANFWVSNDKLNIQVYNVSVIDRTEGDIECVLIYC